MKRAAVALSLVLGVAAGCGSATSGIGAPPVAPARRAAATAVPTLAAASPSPTGTLIADRYGDGIPRTIDGAPVLRGDAALIRARSATQNAPFLVGGWVTYLRGARFCAWRAAGDTSWLDDCVTARLSDRAGAEDPSLAAAVTFRFALDGLSTGPVVASVEVHDPRAGECGSAAAACDRLMVVERIVWTGDATTDPRPLSAEALAGVLREIQGTPALTPWGPSSPLAGCGEELTSAGLFPVPVKGDRIPAVTCVEVEPSVAARTRALHLETGVQAALGQSGLASTSFSRTPTASSAEEFRWLAIANVVLVVRTHHGPTATDRAFLDRLAAALERAASAPT